jgi:hypothetical protein
LNLPGSESVFRVLQTITKLEINKTTAVPGRVEIFLLNHGNVKHLTSIFIPSPKKDVTKCKNNCTHAIFPHANKILLRIIQQI